MSNAGRDYAPLYRVWIAQYQDWRPDRWEDVPPRFRAVEPATAGRLSPEAAAHWLEGFNGAMLAVEKNFWAVAVAVRLRYEGDLVAGQTVGDGGLGDEVRLAGENASMDGENLSELSAHACVSVLQAGNAAGRTIEMPLLTGVP